MINRTLGLDWDGVITHFPQEMCILAERFDAVVIITLNKSITAEKAREVLQKEEVLVEICPDDERDNYAAWKALACRSHGVALMIDDDGFVVVECRSFDVPALAVNAMFVQSALREL
jgi:hypothetical protein